MKAIILFALVASANAFAAGNDNVSAPAPSNCAAASDNKLTNDAPSSVDQKLAMIEGQSTSSKSQAKGSGASR